MAVAATSIIELRSAGNDKNGGGFVPGGTGTDWTQQNAAQYAVADGVAAGTTTLTSATANWGTDVVDNWAYVEGGTGVIVGNWYQIISRTNATTIVVDRNTGLTAGTGVTINVGGAVKTPGTASKMANLTGGVDVWQKNDGVYTVTSASFNVAGGCVSLTTSSASTAQVGRWEGYLAVRGDKGTPPIIRADNAITAFTLFNTAVALFVVDNVEVDCNNRATSSGFNHSTGTRVKYYRLTSRNSTVNGYLISATGCQLFRCRSIGHSGTAGFNASNTCIYSFCEAYDGTCVGFGGGGSNPATFIRCYSYRNLGASVDGFAPAISNGTAFYEGCVAFGNGRHGFRDLAAGVSSVYVNCIAEENAAGWGFASTATNQIHGMFNCAGFNNGLGNVQQAYENVDFVAYTTTAFTNAAAGDFSLNNVTTGGALLRATGYPGVLPSGTSTGYLDRGGIQHQDSGSSAGSGGIAERRNRLGTIHARHGGGIVP